MPWIFLIVSLYGAWFTYNALRPTRHWAVQLWSFFGAWFTAELALFHVGYQTIATIVFVSLGALDSWPGWVGLAVTVLSWAGLVRLWVVSRRAGPAMEEALRAGLGDEYRSEIAPGLAARLAEKQPVRPLLLPVWLRDRRVERIRNLRYAPGAGRRHLLDVYRPRVGVEGAPVLLQIHGGAWFVGDKGGQGLPLMLHLAAQGWVCVANNYRLSPRATWPDHLVDCKLALRWVREHIGEYGGDPDFVVVTGGSAGGHLSTMVALTAGDPTFQPGFEGADTSVAACVPFYGVYDFVDLFEQAGGPQRGADRFQRRFMGATLRENRAAFEQASPMAHVDAGAPPFLVIHGTADNLTPIDQARRFVASLRAVSREPVVYAEVPGASHAFEIFHSVRTGHVVNGVDRFLAWLHSAYRAERPEVPADPVREVAG